MNEKHKEFREHLKEAETTLREEGLPQKALFLISVLTNTMIFHFASDPTGLPDFHSLCQDVRDLWEESRSWVLCPVCDGQGIQTDKAGPRGEFPLCEACKAGWVPPSIVRKTTDEGTSVFVNIETLTPRELEGLREELRAKGFKFKSQGSYD